MGEEGGGRGEEWGRVVGGGEEEGGGPPIAASTPLTSLSLYILYCTVLHILYCTVLYCIVLYCIVTLITNIIHSTLVLYFLDQTPRLQIFGRWAIIRTCGNNSRAATIKLKYVKLAATI